MQAELFIAKYGESNRPSLFCSIVEKKSTIKAEKLYNGIRMQNAFSIAKIFSNIDIIMAMFKTKNLGVKSLRIGQ